MQIHNEDCITGSSKIPDNSVDLFLTDPPFGINGANLHKHYNRNENNVLEGYVEAPDDYFRFSLSWLTQAKRILKDNGSMYIVSGWTNLRHILNAIDELDLFVINHAIWKFNFGVFTKNKYLTSHYHILYVKKSAKAKIKFNTTCRFVDGSPRYKDLEDVWTINKEYKPGVIKNKNKLPDALVEKMIAYSSDPGDFVCDFFMGNFTTAFVSLRMKRIPVGFEINKEAFDYNMSKLHEII